MNLFRKVATVPVIVLRWWADRRVLALIAVTLMASLSAADRTWDGGGGDDNWTTPANWDGDVTAPSAGDNLIFTGTTRTAPSNDFAADTTFGNITFSAGAGAFTLTGNSITVTGTITNNDDTNQTIGLAMIFGGVRTIHCQSTLLSISGVISGAGGITKTGVAPLSLSGANTYTGNTALDGGDVSLYHNTALGNGGTVTIANVAGCKLNLAAGGLTVANPIVINGGSIAGFGAVCQNSGGTGTCSGPITINANTSAGGHFSSHSGGVLILSGVITSSVRVVVRAGNVTVSNTGSSYATIGITAATLTLGANNAVPTTATVELGQSGGSTFNLAGFNQTIAGLTRQATTAEVTSSSGTPTLDVNVSGANTYDGILSGSLALTKTGVGTLTLSGANTYTGTTTVNAGVLSVTGSTAAGSAVTVASGGTLTGTGTVAGTVAVANGGTLAPGAGMGLTASFVATSLRAVTQDDWRLTQTITGTRSDATIDQASSAFGTGVERAAFGIVGLDDTNWDNFSVQWDGYLRVVTAGTNLSTRSDDGSRVWLDLNGNGTVDSGEWGSNGWGNGQGPTTAIVHANIPVGIYRIRVQCEDGNGGNVMHLLWNDAANSAGTVDSIYVVPANLLVGGSSIATLTTGAVTFNSTSNFAVDLNGTTPTYDQLSSTGAVACAGTLTIASMSNPGLGKVYTIINAASLSGTFSGLANGAVTYQQGRNFQIAYTATTVTLTDVAHPTTRIWDGGGADNNWSTAANWDFDIAPIAGDDLQFAGTTRLTPNNDFPGETTFASITFNSGAGAFVIGPQGGSTGVVSREVWTGIGTTDISSIPLTTTANINDTLTSLETPTDWSDLYGTRVRGFVTAPTTGNYTFWLASDDNSELRLSTDVQAANKVLIASVTGFTASREWGKYGSQKSAEIALVAGQKYYIEVLQKEGGGGDNLAVGWAKPGEVTTAPSEVIPGAYLSPYSSNFGITLAGAITNNSSNLQTVNLGLYLSATRAVNCTSGSVALGGIISGSGGLTKAGTNALSLNGANVFTGGVALSAGTLNINHATALGATAGTLSITGGTTIDNTSGGTVTMTANNPQTWNGDFTFTGSNALHLGSGAVAMGAASRQVTVTASTLSVGAIGGAGGLAKQGAGTLALAGACTYAGDTDVLAGTLALGVQTVSGFGTNGSGWTLNGGAGVASDVLTLTDNGGSQARSGFFTTRIPVAGFTTSFRYQASGNRSADGSAVVFHNDSRGASALGTSGGAMGYAGGGSAITPSAAIAINIYVNNTRGTRYLTAGAMVTPFTSIAPIDPASGNQIEVALRYDGSSSLVETLTDLTTSATWTTTHTVGDLTTTVGGASAYLGFTGGTGGEVSTQTISNFAFSVGGSNLLPTTTALAIASGATVDLGGKGQQVASLSNYGGGGGSVTNGGLADSVLNVNGSSSTTFSGIISDGSHKTALVKDGSSTLTLTGTNTFTGTTTISSGTLAIGNGTTDGSIAASASIIDNSALIYNLVGSRTYSNVISGTGTLTKSGAGTLTLGGANTYTGTTTVSAGTLLVTGSTASGSAVGVANAATLGGTGTVAGTITLSAGGILAPGTGGTTIGTLATGAVNCNATSIYSVDLNGTGPTADRTSSSGAVALNGTLTVASITNAAYLRTYTIVSGSSISGTFSGLPNHTIFTQQGRNFLITYNATTVTLTDLDPAYVWVWDGGGVDDNWTTAANWVNDVEPAVGAALQFAGTTRLTPNNDFPADTSFASITFNTGAGAFVIGGNRITLAGGVTNNDDSVQTMNQAMIMAATRTMNAASGNLVFGGILSGAGGLTKTGTSTLTLTATNTYTGVTTISAGTLSVGDGTTDGSIATSSGITNNSALVYNLAGARSYGNVISGTGTLTKAGAGTLTLSATNTYSGATTVTGGILSVSADANLGTAPGAATPGAITLNGGTLQFTGATAITINTNRGIALGSSGGTIDIPITIPVAPSSFDDTNDPGVHYSGIIADVPGQTGSLTVSGVGMLMLYGSSTYSGMTTIDTGWISAPSSGGPYVNILPTTTILNVINGGHFNICTTGGAQTIAGLTGDATGLVGTTNQGSNVPLIINNSADHDFPGILGPLTHPGKTGTAARFLLTKSGSGTQTLSGANTYTGATTVSAGTLLVTGSTAVSAVAVSSGATLGGSGTIGGTITLAAGGILSPGTGGTTIGTLTTANVTCNATSIYVVDLDGTTPTADRDASSGTVALNGTLTVASIANAAYLKVYTIVTGTSITGTFTGMPDRTIFTQQGRNFLISYSTTAVTLTDVDPAFVWVWDGGGADDNWKTDANWVGDLAPGSGAALQFAGTTRMTPNNNFAADTSFGSITFNAGANPFVIGGNRITLAGDVTNNDDSVQTMNQAMIMTATRTANAASGNLVFGGILSGAGGLTKTGIGTLTLTATNTLTGTITISAGTLSVGDGVTDGTINTSANVVNNAALIYNNTTAKTYANVISGTGTLTKNGAGTLTLSGAGANTFSGLTTVSAGQITANKTAGVNAIGGNLTLFGGCLVFGGNHQLPDTCAVTVAAGSTLNGTGINEGTLVSVVETIGSLTMTGGAFNTSATGTWTVTGGMTCTGGAGNTTVTGNSGSSLNVGSLSLTAMTGTVGTVNPSPTTNVPNSFTIFGNNTSQQSVLTVGAGGIALNGSVLNMRRGGSGAHGSRLVLNGDIATSGSAASSIFEDTASGTLTTGTRNLELSGTAAATTRTITVPAGGCDLNIGVPITNGAATPGAITKQGLGTLTFSGPTANTYSGVTTITDGTLVLQKTAGVNAIAGDILMGNANGSDVLRLGASNQIADTSVITFFSGGGGNSAKLELNGYLETVAGIQGNANQASVIQNTESGAATGLNEPAILTVTNTSDYVYDGLIRNGGGGTIGLNKSGAGTLTLRCGFSSNAMNYTGATTVSAGRLVVDNLSGYASPVANTSIAADGLTFTQTSQDLTYGAAISGGGSVTKNGAATLTLSGTNSHTGATTVSAGTLLVTGSTASGSAVTVSSSATLGGSGTVAGTIAVADGGTLAPGTGGTTIATLTTGAVTLNASSVYSVDLNGTTPTFDRVSSSGAVACAGMLTIASLSNAALGNVYTIVAAGSVSGTFSGRANNSVFIHAGRLFRITYAATTVTLTDVAPVVSSRQTLDVDGDGQIDRVRLTFDQNLNDNTSGVTVTVTGYTVSGFNVGTANDNVIDVLLTESGAGDTGATPSVRITVNSSLMDDAGTTLIQVEGSGTAATDTAAPVLLSTAWTDAGTGGVSAGDTVTLTFSESITVSSMAVGELGLPVSGDTLSSTTIADQSGATVTMTLAGTPQLTPGQVYSSAALTAGRPSGVYLSDSSSISDAVALSPATGNAASARDLGSSDLLSIAWISGTNPKAWVLGTVALGHTANTDTAGLDLALRNVGATTVDLAIVVSASAPSGWSPAVAAGTDAFLLKVDNAGLPAGDPTNPAAYEMTLTTTGQSLVANLLSGVATDLELYIGLPTAITSGGGVQQTTTVTITATLPP